jgi:hypothetical protein
MFCVGVSTAFRLINRLDRLMLAAKDIVGEQYHIHGVGMYGLGSGLMTPRTGEAGGGGNQVGVELGARVSTVQFQPPRDV